MEGEARLQDEEKTFAGINMTPLVDVSLTLVLIFMVTMPPVMIHGVTVKSDTLSQYGLSTPQDNIFVRLSTSGIFIQDGEGQDQLVPYKDFGVILRQMIQISNTGDVYFRVERNIPHGQSVWAIDLAKQNGANSVAIMERGL